MVRECSTTWDGRHSTAAGDTTTPRVGSEYQGTGELAELTADLIRCEQAEQRAAREAQRQGQEAGRATDTQIDAAGRLARLLTEAVLLVSGYYHHHGEWRKVPRGE